MCHLIGKGGRWKPSAFHQLFSNLGKRGGWANSSLELSVFTASVWPAMGTFSSQIYDPLPHHVMTSSSMMDLRQDALTSCWEPGEDTLAALGQLPRLPHFWESLSTSAIDKAKEAASLPSCAAFERVLCNVCYCAVVLHPESQPLLARQPSHSLWA